MTPSSNPLNEILRAAKPMLWYMALFSFFINILFLAVPLYSLQVLDRVLSTGSTDTLLWLTVIMVVALLVSGALQVLRSYILLRTSEWLSEKLGPSLLMMIIARAADSGKRGAQAMRDLNTVTRFINGQTLLTLFDAPWALIYLLTIFVINAQLGLITLAGAVILCLFAALNEFAIRRPLEGAGDIEAGTLQQVDIAIRNAEALESMGMTEAVIAAWQRKNRQSSELQQQANSRSIALGAIARFLRLVLQIAIIGCGAALALHNEITSGSIIAASILTGRALAPFDAAIATWKSLVETRKSYANLSAALDQPARREGVSLPPPQGNLSVEKLTYSVSMLPEPIIKQVSFTLNRGEVLGIVGPSAAGKSTLAKLCAGISEPGSGAVRLDGVNVRQWRRDEIGRHVGYLPQDIEFFSGSVRDNIARMQPEATDAEVVGAAMKAGAHELIARLPDGYKTRIGQGGIVLSAGQRQRIALARAMFGDPRLLVLDEPDASLDAEGEQGLAWALENAKKQAITSLIITHRRRLVSYIDKLLVMKDGGVFLFGPTNEVLAALEAHAARTEQETMRIKKAG